ncbi:MAG: lipopolysaccharide heptosyltransferase II [Deltaproteobacteria bacterium]|nr:lipopolysaccharide heptosyltransferase II [Deltaproteobacteria bacterium]
MRVRYRNEISPGEIQKILVRATNWVGDAVLITPSLVALKKTFPHAQITVLANPWVLPLLVNHPAVDRTMIIDKGTGLLCSMGKLTRIISNLRNEGFDLAVLFQNAFEAAFLASMGGVRYRIGYNTDGRGFLLTHTVIRDEHILGVHQVDYYLGLIEAMGWQVEGREPSLFLNARDIETTSLMLSSHGIEDHHVIVGLNPGATYGSAKRWPEERFAAIGDWAVERWNATVILFGSSSERDIGLRVSRRMQHAPINLCGLTTLGEVMALIKRCNFFVTNDSGLMHIAAAFHVPLVALFGPTNHITTGPVSETATIVRHAFDCSPCLKETCPLDHRCMLSIEPDEVWDAMESLKRELKI